MAYKMFAAIYVGSSELAMKVFQINGKKSFKLVDEVVRIAEIGKDTYNNGRLTMDSIKKVCETIEDFKSKMREYQIIDYRAYASSAVREAENAEIVIEAIKRRTGISVKILSNSEQRYMNYKGLVAKYKDFHQVVSKNTAFVDVGAGSVQISLFDKNNLVVTENIPIGAVRIREYLSIVGTKTGRYDKVLSEYVDGDIEDFRNIYINDKEIKNIIAIGEVLTYMKKVITGDGTKLDMDRFEKAYSIIVNMSPQQLTEKYGIPYERATLMLPGIIIYRSLLKNCKAEEIYAPDVDFCDGIVASYMDEGARIVFDHDFEEDIIATAYNMSKRYKCNKTHIDKVTEYAMMIFDCVKKEYGMGRLDRLQLKIAAILHESGNFINLHDDGENSYYIVANTEMLGLSHKERMEVANIVKYNKKYLPSKEKMVSYLEGCDYMKIAKLTAILRIADILDKGRKNKIDSFSVSIKDDKLFISANTFEDMLLEAGLFEKRADFFETVYGIRPVFRQKRGVL